MRLLAPAKINLYLRVGKRRDDGFHPLSTWMCTVGLFDILTLEAIAQPASETPGAPARGASLPTTGRAGEPAGVPLDLRFDCDQPGLPRDEGNLVVRIAEAFAAEVFAPSLAGGGRASPSADGGTGETARGGGGEDGSGYAGVARVKAPGIGDAGRSRSVGPVTDGTERGAGATRDAERPVGEDDERSSPPGEGSSRNRKAEAPAAPAPRRAPAPSAFAAGATHPRDVGEAAVRIVLSKQIPVGAGLGGGSSDAARTLLGLNRLWNAGRTAKQLSAFAARFGSDVPFFVAAGSGAAKAGSAACAGRGEIVRPVPRPGAKWALLVLPPFSLATREVYARFDEMRLGSDRDVADEPDWTQWAALPAEMLLARVDNDLEPAAFSLSPHLAAMREDLAGLLGRTVRMSGSGSSLFTLYDADEARQARAAEKLVDRAHNLAAKLVELAPALEDDLARSR